MKPTLKEVDDYQVPEFLIQRVADAHDYDIKFSKNLAKEAKRMLYLSIVSDDSISPSNRVDDMWHEMIIFTRFYKDFGEFIGGFIHHNPTSPERAKKLKRTKDGEVSGYAKTKANYEKYFNQKPDPKYWP